ncbi:hypothetical protein [Marinomonas transparens]|uniref:Uncharacterized protein n=1 Tax=Marinomonas transparens TaxID=2795388 RepID=A0A934JQH0_9GAMM|nr:hypothetical protein [Marinomonas transparens]MBJ7540061.1 hypothetical protein [Marinomonas transparens]
MMVLLGILFLALHFYICKISVGFFYYLGMLNIKNIKNLFLQNIIYLITLVLVVANILLNLFTPLMINEKLGFVFFSHDKTDPLLWYGVFVLVLTTWLAYKKYPYVNR